MFPDKTTLWIVRMCVLGLVACGLYFWGRGNGVEFEARRQSVQQAVCQADRAVLATTLDEANARTHAAKAAEKQQAARAEAAEQGATLDGAAYEQRIGSIAAELEKAKRQATCRAQLEAPLCASLQ